MQQKATGVPGIILSAFSGGSGKTLLSIGITAAFTSRGNNTAPFKKGPDYIDAGWLSLAARRPCYNLDTFLCDKNQVFSSFLKNSKTSDIAVIEGNRGLYDGIDLEGSTSTAELAKLLTLPVILCIDCTKTTRTMAAAVSGCISFDPDVMIKGVILNRVAGPRHENILRTSIEHHCGIPVLGSVPKLKKQSFPERHMGLVPTPEHEWAKDSIETAKKVVIDNVDLDVLAEIAKESASPQPAVSSERSKIFEPFQQVSDRKSPNVRIGILRDAAFQFYYNENLEALQAQGAETIFLSPIADKQLPDIDALYIGGGFPETSAKELSENKGFRKQVKDLVENGLPVYAECGGLMYLGEELILDEKTYPMTGTLPIVFGISNRPQGHGYTISSVDKENPWFDIGTELRGHEFRYSTVLQWNGQDEDMVFSTNRGTGFMNQRDGICYKNVLASYTHLHSLGTPFWAEAMVRNAVEYKRSKD